MTYIYINYYLHSPIQFFNKQQNGRMYKIAQVRPTSFTVKVVSPCAIYIIKYTMSIICTNTVFIPPEKPLSSELSWGSDIGLIWPLPNVPVQSNPDSRPVNIYQAGYIDLVSLTPNDSQVCIMISAKLLSLNPRLLCRAQNHSLCCVCTSCEDSKVGLRS